MKGCNAGKPPLMKPSTLLFHERICKRNCITVAILHKVDINPHVECTISETKVLLDTYGHEYLLIASPTLNFAVSIDLLRYIRNRRIFFHRAVQWGLYPLIYLVASPKRRKEIDLWSWSLTDTVSWREPARCQEWQRCWWPQLCWKTDNTIRNPQHNTYGQWPTVCV